MNIKIIPINAITCHNLPINPEGFKTAQNWHLCKYKPIKVIQQVNGMYRVKDGRHRYLGARLNGEKYMRCIVLYKELKNGKHKK